MSTSVIKIKRSTGTTAPEALSAGELAYSFGTGAQNNGGDRLYFGNGSTIDVIGGKYFTGLLAHVPGQLTASSAILVDSNKKVDEFLVDNLKLDANTISSTDTDGAIVLGPNGAGKIEFNVADNAAAFARVTGATATQYKDNITTAADDNAIPNKKYVDDVVSNASSNTDLRVSGDTGDVTVNLADDDLNIVTSATAGISTALTRGTGGTANEVTLEISLDQDLSTGGSPTFVDLTLTGDAAVDGGDLTTTATTFNLVNATATTVNFAGAGTAISIGAGSGTTTVNNNLAVALDATVTGDVAVNGGDLTTTATTFNLVNATATTVNFAGAGTTVSVGAASGTTTVNNNLAVTLDATVTGDIAVNGGDITTTASTFNLVNATATTVNFAGAGTAVSIGAATGTTTVNNDLVVTGDVAVNGGDITSTAATVNVLAGVGTVNIGKSDGSVVLANDVTVSNDLTVTGNLTVNGSTVTVNVATIEVEDSLIKLARGNTSTDSISIGFYGSYGSTGEKKAGLFRSHTDDEFYLFTGLTGDITTGNVISTAGLTLAALNTGDVSSSGTVSATTLVGEIDGGTY
jgi:hypothetical protein